MNATKSHEQNLFEAALHLKSQAEREAFLQVACATDPGLRRRIDQLLAAATEADAFFSGDPLKQAGLDEKATIPIPISPAATEQPGMLIGRYKLLQQIGEGGCGVVYMAEQEEPLCRKIALKVIKLGMDTRSVVARFEAERQALALMDHPNIAKVFDAGTTEGPHPSSRSPLPSDGRGIKGEGGEGLASSRLLGYAPLKVATRMGSSPMISCVRGRRVDWLHHRVFKIGGHGRIKVTGWRLDSFGFTPGNGCGGWIRTNDDLLGRSGL